MVTGHRKAQLLLMPIKMAFATRIKTVQAKHQLAKEMELEIALDKATEKETIPGKDKVQATEAVAVCNKQSHFIHSKISRVMKTKNMIFGLMLVASAAFGFISCNNSPAVDNELIEKSATMDLITNFPVLVSGEDAGILLMREEEKMAHDVYTVFGNSYDLPIFNNIANSETNHYNAMGTLISTYQLTDPSTGIAGTFTNTTISNLYAKLVEAGSGSVEEALKTGAYIEEYDIVDLEKLIAATGNTALQQIYGNLLRGSRNHLRAFVATLKTYQVTYVPEVMSAEDFEAIISTPMEPGNQNGMMNGNGNKNGKGKGGNGNKGAGGQKGQGTGTGVCING